MIKIRYSTEPYEELDLEGSRSELFALYQAITGPDWDDFAVPGETEFDPSPYHACLSSLRVSKRDDLLCIAVRDRQLHISGKPELLALFAENLPYDAEQTSQAQYHVHFDRAGMEQYVSENSLDITMTLKN